MNVLESFISKLYGCIIMCEVIKTTAIDEHGNSYTTGETIVSDCLNCYISEHCQTKDGGH